MKCLSLLKHWDRRFESNSEHGCLSAFLLCSCCPVQQAALQQGWLPVHVVLQIVCKVHSSRLFPMGNDSESLIPKEEEKEEEEPKFEDTIFVTNNRRWKFISQSKRNTNVWWGGHIRLLASTGVEVPKVFAQCLGLYIWSLLVNTWSEFSTNSFWLIYKSFA
jgi:hypothetical protein